MQRMAHGSTISIEPEDAGAGIEELDDSNPLASPSDAASSSIPFGYLFPDLQETSDALLPEGPETLETLSSLGATMLDSDEDASFNSTIPSAYTYFGQFVDHDISFTKTDKTPPDLSDSCVLGDSQLKPFSKDEVLQKVHNQRAAILELEPVYNSFQNNPQPPRDNNNPLLMARGQVSKSGHRPKGKDDCNDLVRSPKNADARHDRVAVIGDPRNDSNIVLSQLHVAFLRAHNATVDFVCQKNLAAPGEEFEEAQKLLRQHYHWIIIHDFLKKQIADPNVVDEVLSNPKPIYNPTANGFFLPLEFTVAAYRFGHSMIRSTYYLNDNYRGETLARLFTLIVLSNDLKPTPGKGAETLPEDRIIQWRKFLRGGKNKARKLNPRMVEPLFSLLDETDQPVPCERRLAVQDLKRGYMMRIPTGQAVAQALGMTPLTNDEIEAVAISDEQRALLHTSGLSSRTPLWFYLLAEAAQGGGNRLGAVGSRLVAEVLIGLVRRLPYSFLKIQNWSPTLPSIKRGVFDLSDLLRLAGVLEDQ
jgi:hypothetical protein